MQEFRTPAFLIAWSVMAASSYAGVANSFVFPTPITTTVADQVTYGTTTPLLDTFVIFDVGRNGVVAQRQNNNNVKKFVLEFVATVKAPGSLVALDNADLTVLAAPSSTFNASECTAKSGNPAKVTCKRATMRQGESYPAFTVALKAPKDITATNDCKNATTETDRTLYCNRVETQVILTYAEGTNDTPTGFVNSQQESDPGATVALGTANPTDVKSAVPKGLTGGVKLFTGTAPKQGTDPTVVTTQFTESVVIPEINGSAYAKASIAIRKSENDEQCTNLGNFSLCPLFQTSIVDPYTDVPLTFTADVVTFVHQIDGSMLKRPFNQILNNTLIYHSANGDFTTLPSSQPLVACTVDGQVNEPGRPCIDMRTPPVCFKNLSATGNPRDPDLVGDCRWTLLSDSNGFIKFN